MIRLFRILFLLLSAAAILAGGAFFWLKGEFGKPGPLAVEKAVVIPRGIICAASTDSLGSAACFSSSRTSLNTCSNWP